MYGCTWNLCASCAAGTTSRDELMAWLETSKKGFSLHGGWHLDMNGLHVHNEKRQPDLFAFLFYGFGQNARCITKTILVEKLQILGVQFCSTLSRHKLLQVFRNTMLSDTYDSGLRKLMLLSLRIKKISKEQFVSQLRHYGRSFSPSASKEDLRSLLEDCCLSGKTHLPRYAQAKEEQLMLLAERTWEKEKMDAEQTWKSDVATGSSEELFQKYKYKYLMYWKNNIDGELFVVLNTSDATAHIAKILGLETWVIKESVYDILNVTYVVVARTKRDLDEGIQRGNSMFKEACRVRDIKMEKENALQREEMEAATDLTSARRMLDSQVGKPKSPGNVAGNWNVLCPSAIEYGMPFDQVYPVPVCTDLKGNCFGRFHFEFVKGLFKLTEKVSDDGKLAFKGTWIGHVRGELSFGDDHICEIEFTGSKFEGYLARDSETLGIQGWLKDSLVSGNLISYMEIEFDRTLKRGINLMSHDENQSGNKRKRYGSKPLYS